MSRFALTVRQPWAHLIIHAGKDIENRTWSAKFRGRIFIHAAKGMTRDEWLDALQFCNGMDPMWTTETFPKFESFERGGIIGEVDIIGCVADSQSPWFVGPCGFVLKNPKPLPFVPCKGALGFFRLPEGVKV